MRVVFVRHGKSYREKGQDKKDLAGKQGSVEQGKKDDK
jgi:hypothetical protein